MRFIKQDTDLPIAEPCIEGVTIMEENDKTKILRHGPLFPNSHLRIICCGPSNSGKTCSLMSLIYNKSGISFKNIYVFSKTLYQKKYVELEKVLKTVPEIGYFTFTDCEQVPTLDEIKPFSLLIFDDVSTEAGKNRYLRSYFCQGRHKFVDVAFVGQTYSAVPKQLVRDNANILILYPCDTLNMRHAYDDMASGDMKFEKFCEICRAAWNDAQYSCLVINKECPLDNGRYRVGFDTYIVL